ncbi:unnamed protein product [Hermetia illucens]|uniref:mRNA m(6)A methyltransferase n=1 Tax=Hermetia illucens TaxID=343691 RepID=A0A7R8YLY1_HERIL|nr:N6-adenosine-methyltransferase MT-A70-like protein [Hermetia illucens]CAD7078006.1 unnamed protein product [Hermetia illucens]
MAEAWDDIQAIKTKRNTLRERLEKRKKERQDILSSSTLAAPLSLTSGLKSESFEERKSSLKVELDTVSDVDRTLLQILSDGTLLLPVNSVQLGENVEARLGRPVTKDSIQYFLKKLAAQSIINIKNVSIGSESGYEVILVDQKVVLNLNNEFQSEGGLSKPAEDLKRKHDSDIDDDENSSKSSKFEKKSSLKEQSNDATDIMSLLSMPSTLEKQSKQVGEEILELLTKPTAKERFLAEKFKSHGGAQVMEFCPHGTKAECLRAQQATAEMTKNKKSKLENENSDSSSDKQDTNANNENKMEKDSSEVDDETTDKCTKLHFKKIIQSHTDESLGDCSFLNTCFHMATCKYVHYEVDHIGANNNNRNDISKSVVKRTADPSATLYPPQWIQCDLRYLDMTVLGKFAVVMADPPWDIHMELPYGTMSDDEMRQLGVPALQDDGLIFLWVTGRAMELGRECLKLWGYERVDELIWVKTNQLQRIIRTGRTGHWLNHGKEHCLVGMKGNPKNLNRGLDCDVIVAEVRATSHKPDEIYGIIERLSPGTRKIELFGRPHNVQPNWITLGNQLDGIRLVDPELITQFQKRYPDGNCMAPTPIPKK